MPLPQVHLQYALFIDYEEKTLIPPQMLSFHYFTSSFASALLPAMQCMIVWDPILLIHFRFGEAL